MEKKSFRNLWLFIFNGLIAVAFGFLLIAFTAEFMKTLVFYFGLLVLAGGVIMLIPAIRNLSKNKKPAWTMLQSVIAIATGIVIMLFPGNSLRIFLVVIGVWAVLAGIFQTIVLVNSGREISRRNIFLLNGLLTIALGVILILFPVEVASLVARLIGLVSILFGCIGIWLAIETRKALKKETGAA